MHDYRIRNARQLSVKAIGLFCLAWLSACSTEIIHDLEEGEANQILSSLTRHGIQGEKIRTAQGSRASYTITVARPDAVNAWQVLRQQNLPRPKPKGLGEVFGKSSLIPTATQERALMHHALAGELSRTLQSVEGVLEARVHVVMPSKDPLAPADEPKAVPKASVLLRVGATSPLSEEETQRLVAGAVKDLAPEAVSVLVVSGQDRGTEMQPVTAGAMARLGPFTVARGSRGALLATLIIGLVLVMLLGLGLLLVLKRSRTLAARARQAASLPGQRGREVESSLNLVGRSLSRGSRVSTGEGRGKP